MYYVQRSEDGATVYLRRAPLKKWDAVLAVDTGALWMFQDLPPGQGWYYRLTRAK